MKNNIFKYIFIAFIILIIIYAVYSICGKAPKEKEKPQTSNKQEETLESKDLRLGISNYDTINPLVTQNKEVINVDKLIYESLVTIKEDYQMELTLAKECLKISPITYIIKVNTEILWHNETSLTAKDVAFTIQCLKQGRSVYSNNVEKISNVEVIDAETLQLTLIEEVPFFEYNLTFPILSNEEYLEEDFYASTKVPSGTRNVYSRKNRPKSSYLTKERKVVEKR